MIKQTSRLPLTSHRTPVRRWLPALLLACCLPACSTASAVGCLSGVGAGMLLAGIAAAGANGDPNQAPIDAGTAVLGGALFGVVSGCTAAAIADAIASDRHAKKPREREPTEHDSDLTQSAPTVQQPAPERTLSVQARLGDITLSLAGRPELGSKQVTVRFGRYGVARELSSCAEVEVQIDERVLRYPLVSQVETHGSVVKELAQTTFDSSVLRALSAAKHVHFRLCALERELTLAAHESLAKFTREFELRAPAQSTDASASAATPGPAPDASTSAPKALVQAHE